MTVFPVWFVGRLGSPTWMSRCCRRAYGLGRRRLLGRLDHDTEEAPWLGLGQPAGFHNLHVVASPRLVGLVVNMADRAAGDVLAVARVLDQARNLDAAGLVHFVAGHDADLDSALATFCFHGH